MLAVVYFMKYFKHYLLGKEFILRTDHGSLISLDRFKEPDRQICRWLQQIGPFNFRIVHRPGKRHSNAGGLSRILVNSNETVCRQCKRKPDDVYDGALESHVNELPKHQSETDLCIDQATCDTHHLFNTTENKSDNKQSTGKGRKENRPRRAKPQPETDVD